MSESNTASPDSTSEDNTVEKSVERLWHVVNHTSADEPVEPRVDDIRRVLMRLETREQLDAERCRALNDVTTQRDSLNAALLAVARGRALTAHECTPPERDPREPTGDPRRLHWTCECGRRWIYLRRIEARQVVGQWRERTDLNDPPASIGTKLHEFVEEYTVPQRVASHSTMEPRPVPEVPLQKLAEEHPSDSPLPLESFGTHGFYVRTAQGLKPMVPGAFTGAVFAIDMPPGKYMLGNGTQFKVMDLPTQFDWTRVRENVPTNFEKKEYPTIPPVGLYQQTPNGPGMAEILRRYKNIDIEMNTDALREWRFDELPRPERPARDDEWAMVDNRLDPPLVGPDAALREQLQEDAAHDADAQVEQDRDFRDDTAGS